MTDEVLSRLRSLRGKAILAASQARVADVTYQHEVTAMLVDAGRPGARWCPECGEIFDTGAKCACPDK